MRPRSIIAVVAAAITLLASGHARGNWARSDLSTKSTTTQSTFTAGTDQVNTWYGLDWKTDNGYAELTSTAGASATRALVQAIPMPAAAKYSFSLDTQCGDFKTQSNYWHVLAVKAGTTLKLDDKGIPSTISMAGVKSLWSSSPPGGSAAHKWKTYSTSITISSADASAYEYLVIALVGSRGSSDELLYDNVWTDAPSSSTASAGLNCIWVTTPKGASKLSGISWSSPFRTSTEEQINWPNTTVAFYKGGPANMFAMKLTGSITVPTTGSWVFSLGSDDGSAMYIDGALVVNNDGAHSYTTKTGTVALTAGVHAFEVQYFEYGGSHGLVASWQGPSSTSSTLIPFDAFAPSAAKKARIVNWNERPSVN